MGRGLVLLPTSFRRKTAVRMLLEETLLTLFLCHHERGPLLPDIAKAILHDIGHLGFHPVKQMAITEE